VRTLRDPASVAPALAIPLLLYLVVTAGMSEVTNIEGFPTDSFPTFALALMFANGAMAIIASTGQLIATDIESRFIDRLVLTPMRGIALLLSQLAGVLVLGLIQSAVFFAVGFLYGAHIEAGVGGALVLVAMFLLSVVGTGTLGLYVGLRTGSGQAVQAIAPVMLAFLFLSSVMFPRNLITTDWFKTVATINPLSYLVEGMRSLLITGWDTEALALGFAVAGGLALISIVAAASALRRRLAT
jgi:ABC-2 type transport system permease protein